MPESEVSTTLETAVVQVGPVLKTEVLKAEPISAPPAPGLSWAPFALIAIEFGWLVLLFRTFELESSAFGSLMLLAWVGFVVHHFLPARLRLPFFGFLSVFSVYFYLALATGSSDAGGLERQATVVQKLLNPTVLLNSGLILVVGAVLIAICHLPVSWTLRFMALGVAAVALVASRLSLQGLALPDPVWSIVGSMFMFRLILYVYELYHQTTRSSPARAVAYFFMMPNVAFPLFPIVDYKSFCSSHYRGEPLWIYQKGLRLILRGVIQLLIYRAVYHFGVVEATSVSNLVEVCRFLVTTSLLYLQVSGSFHIIVGLLHLFGFNLPATHHLYFLSSNFTDLWRRNNIYWRDFIARIFFNPAYLRFKRLGATGALVGATVVAFAATWMLHSYQDFWLRGKFPLAWQDAVFWVSLCCFVMVNTLTEARRGRQRRLVKTRRTLWSETSLALKTIGTYVTLWWILWMIWSRPTPSEFAWLTKAAQHYSAGQIALVVGGLAGLGLAAVVFGRLSRADLEGAPVSSSFSSDPSFWYSVASVAGVSTALLLIGTFGLKWTRDATAAQVLLKLTRNMPSDLEMALQRRGYYEQIDQAKVGRDDRVAFNKGQRGDPLRAQGPPNYVTLTHDFMFSELKPSYSGMIDGKLFTTNRWKMRDHDFEMEKPAGVYRIALLGSSNEMGMGVADSEVFKQLVEDRLNRNDVGGNIQRFEIMNFALRGQDAFQKLGTLENRVWQFSPDAVFWVTYALEDQIMVRRLSQVFKQEIEIPEPYRQAIQDVFRKQDCDSTVPEERIMRGLQPYAEDLLRFIYQRMIEQCSQRGIRIWMVYRPDQHEAPDVAKGDRARTFNLLQSLGLPTFDLTPGLNQARNRKGLMVEGDENHYNEEGHRLLAEELYKQLHALRLANPKSYLIPTDNFVLSKLRASFQTLTHDKLFTTNRWGMRDRAYEKEKAPGVYRIALLGSSDEMGIGVGDDETFKHLVEDRLNHQDVGGQIRKIEILNFAREDQAAFQKLYSLEEEGFAFAPDAVFWTISSVEDTSLIPHLAKVVKNGYAIPEPYRATIRSVCEQAGIQPSFREGLILTYLQPFGDELLRFVYSRLADLGRQRHIAVYVLYRPDPHDSSQTPNLARQRMIALAQQAGLRVIDLSAAYSAVSDRKTLLVSENADHVNAEGHRLLAEQLYKELHPNGGPLLLRITGNSGRDP
jgi:hypothetical protein